jgi:hypothetical protein
MVAVPGVTGRRQAVARQRLLAAGSMVDGIKEVYQRRHRGA